MGAHVWIVAGLLGACIGAGSVFVLLRIALNVNSAIVRDNRFLTLENEKLQTTGANFRRITDEYESRLTALQEAVLGAQAVIDKRNEEIEELKKPKDSIPVTRMLDATEKPWFSFKDDADEENT